MSAAPVPAAAQPGAPNQVLENIWTVFAHNINSGTCPYIEMPLTLKAVLGDEGVTIIALRFRNLIQAPVTIFEDSDRAVLQVMPSHNNAGHKESIPGARDPKVMTTKKSKVARPANAFILYRQHHHPLLKAKNPDMHNNEISIILGKQWRMESEKNKSRFINMAKQLKTRHQHEHPDYQYQPRKPSEKKRRMTQRKKAALAEATQSQPSSSINTDAEVIDLTASSKEGDPAFPKTVGGNPMIELGGEDLDEMTLAAMLEQHNNSLTPFNNNNAIPPINNQLAHLRTQISPPVIYAEASEEAQGQKNFYANFNAFNSNEYLTAELEAMIQDRDEFYAGEPDYDADEIQAKFDKEQEYLFNAELNRMCHWNDEPVLRQ